MTTPTEVFEFQAPILRQDSGLRYHYFPVPAEIAACLQESGSKRVVVTIKGNTYRRALQSTKKAPCVIVGLDLLREVSCSLGDVIAVKIISDPEADVIEMGEEFTEVLKQDPDASKRFYSMTIGQRRSLAYYATSAKRSDTRVKRAFELARKLRTYTLNSDLSNED